MIGQFFGQLLRLLIAVVSIGYCFSHIIEFINGMERSSRAIAQLTRSIKGGV